MTSNLDAEIEKTVLTIYRREGVCEADEFIRAVTPESHPLHHLLEWDDTIAGHKYRQWQSRSIIARVSVNEVGERAPRFVPIAITDATGQRRHGYAPIEDAMSNDDLRAQVIGDAIAGLRSWQRRLAGIKGAAAAQDKLVEAIALLEEEGS